MLKGKAVKDMQALQEETLYLLNCHQDLSALLSEMESPPCKKICSEKQRDCRNRENLIGVSELLIGSVMQEQASRLGLPVGILLARTGAASLGQICQVSGKPSHTALLDVEQKKRLSCLLKTLEDLLLQNKFCRSVFCQELWKLEKPLVLEVAWCLHKENIVGLEMLLDSAPDLHAAVDWLYTELCCLCGQMAACSSVSELPETILLDVMLLLVQNGFQCFVDVAGNREQAKILQISLAVLDKMLSWLLDAVAAESQEDSSRLQTAKHWLNTFEKLMSRSTISLNFVEQFFIHTLTQILTYRPLLKVSDAVRMQGDWNFVKTCPLLTTLYRKIFVVLNAEKLIRHLQEVLETQEVNWQHVLNCVSTLVVCQSEAELLVKDLLVRLLTKAFEGYELEYMIMAFLLARQSALEGPAAFMSYTEWFKVSFGNASGYHGSSKKSLIFLLKFLSDLVPFEAPHYLKVHILYPPFVQTKYRPLLLEYITLAKTRLADLKVSIEDMGLYEDLSSAKEGAQPQSQALQDVEKAINIFENTGKIPASVMEASIFRRPYFTGRFLPMLLKPRVLPKAADSWVAFIDALKRADKIPASVYSEYIQGCHLQKQKLLEGGSVVEMDIDQSEEPFKLLKAALEEMRQLMTDSSRSDALPPQIALISERLQEVTAGRKEDHSAAFASPIQMDAQTTDLKGQDKEVVDLLLTFFCQSIMVASCLNPPDRQGTWPSLFVKMLCGHPWVIAAVLIRLLQLICNQASLLSDVHVVGLAAFVIHLNECRTLIPRLETAAYSCSLSEYWNHLLKCRTGKSLAFCLRFCTAAISYALCKFSSDSPDVLRTICSPFLIKKIHHVLPRVSLEARGIKAKAEEEAAAPWGSLSDCSVNWKRTALCLWKQKILRELMKEQTFQLSFRDWVLLELEVLSDEDELSEGERREYHRWAVYQCYLPMSSADGGCGGNLQQACVEILHALMDFCRRSGRRPLSLLKEPESWDQRRAGSADILYMLQEMTLDLELASPYSTSHFLLQVFKERLQVIGTGSELEDQLLRKQELLTCNRILLSLPPSILIAVCGERKCTTLSSADFFHFINTELRNYCPRAFALPYNITAHFFRGLLSSSLRCEQPAREVDSVLTACRTKCPIILSSTALWWPLLEPVICSQWKRYGRSSLTKELEELRMCHHSAVSFLTSSRSFIASDTLWVSAAFLYFNIQSHSAHGRISEMVKSLGNNTEQILICLLFFCIMDLISAKVVPKEGEDLQKLLGMCLTFLQCLQERGVCWFHLFFPAGEEQEPYQVLHRAASEQHIRLLPIAFYSLVPCLQQDALIQKQDFVSTAVHMYAKLFQLFLEGEQSPVAGQSLKQMDSLDLLASSRHYLLHIILQCPTLSALNVNQILSTYEEFDPEVKAALLHFSPVDDAPALF
ncbi:Fanconi anemia group A protein [Microcaecilia unicolor]|uniref:Fanconi anemia group A protein-like n=1 Tax=Microcaecilia unicolor TaxID=1415580 RepID=A0A6P7YD04_9AMPH|nr:Fanconi anemia group A protein-like [Microcaecilia unicolor]